MKIAVAAHSPEGEIVGIGSIGVGNTESISRAEVAMRDPADPVAPQWKVTVQFDPPMSAAYIAPTSAKDQALSAVREAMNRIEKE